MPSPARMRRAHALKRADLMVLRERLLFLLDESEEQGSPDWGLEHPFKLRAARAVELINAALPEGSERWWDANEKRVRAFQAEDQKASESTDADEESFIKGVEDLLARLRADYVRSARVIR